MRRNETIKWMLALAAGGLVLVLAALPARAQQGRTGPAAQANTPTQTGQLNRKDYQFLVQAARIDLGEVQLGELAQKQSASEAVRGFGEHMINDHSKANMGLKEIATQKGATVPTQLSSAQNSMLQHLGGLSGAQFDKAYAQDMFKGHTHAVKAFATAAKDLSDTDLRAWAQTTLPLLQEHLRMARKMEVAVQSEK
jgi:putative membrane protein